MLSVAWDEEVDKDTSLGDLPLRIPDGWGRWISCSRGWYPIIIRLDRDLTEIEPHYELHQAKEKIARLEYYYSTQVSDARERMDALVDEAASCCERTCELCGWLLRPYTRLPQWTLSLFVSGMRNGTKQGVRAYRPAGR